MDFYMLTFASFENGVNDSIDQLGWGGGLTS